MSLEDLKKAGMQLAYPKNTWGLRIPHVPDVLCALQLTRKEMFLSSCKGVNPAYVSNTFLVASAVAGIIYEVYSQDPSQAEQIIAQAIVDLSPAEACCLRNQDFAAAHAVLNPETRGKNAEELSELCECEKCQHVRLMIINGLACGD